MIVPLLDEFDDADPFKTRGSSIDSIDVRCAIKRIVNVLNVRDAMFIGELSIEVVSSIERTETMIKHLMKLGIVSYMSDEELAARSMRVGSFVVKLEREKLNELLGSLWDHH